MWARLDLYYLQYLVHSDSGRAVLDDPAMDRRNLSSNGQPLPIAFNGSALAYVGWQVLLYHLRHHDHRLGVGRHGLDALGLPQHQRHASRGHVHRDRIGNAVADLVFVIACMFIIPIPWVMRWYGGGRVRNSNWSNAA